MFNIKFMGEYVSDEQLIKRESIPEDAIEFGIISDVKSTYAKGFLFMLPIIAAMLLALVIKFTGGEEKISMGIHLVIAAVILIVSLRVLPVVHEIIHALFYPASAEKGIWMAKKEGARFVYCEEAISKKRFIFMLLAPMFTLGIIPFIVWFILSDYIVIEYNLALALLFLIMTLIGFGDLANAFIIINEVPKNKKIIHHGFLRSFYIN